MALGFSILLGLIDNCPRAFGYVWHYSLKRYLQLFWLNILVRPIEIRNIAAKGALLRARSHARFMNDEKSEFRDRVTIESVYSSDMSFVKVEHLVHSVARKRREA